MKSILKELERQNQISVELEAQFWKEALELQAMLKRSKEILNCKNNK